MMTDATFLITDQNEKVFLPPAPEGLPDLQDIIAEEVLTESVSQGEFEQLADPTAKEYKIYQHMEGYAGSRTALPTEMDYCILNLHDREILDRGLRVAVEFYAEYDPETDEFRDLVVREDHRYTYAPYRMIPSQLDEHITWFLNDGSAGHTKVKTTYFNPKKGAKIHAKRKEANVLAIKEEMIQLFTKAFGQREGISRLTILDGYLFQPSLTYVKGNEWSLIDAIQAYDDELFDYPLHQGANAPTVREYIVSELTIPKFIPEAE